MIETVAASATLQTLGATGKKGDRLDMLLIVPATVDPGNVIIKDGTNAAVTVFAGGTGSVPSLIPFPVVIGEQSLQGAWQITTGTNVSVVAMGNFT